MAEYICTERLTKMTDISHAVLMDGIYRYQRLFYDATRKYYLLGRDHLITKMQAKPGETVLEIACGTGRNLQLIGKRYPQTQLYGLDISEQMLISAQKKLGAQANLAKADACHFDPQALWQQQKFDHIVLSYCLSMIPNWQASLSEAKRHLAPGGSIHIVDFGDQAGLPNWFKRVLLRWLTKFHVSPRDELAFELSNQCNCSACTLEERSLFRGYAHYAKLTF